MAKLSEIMAAIEDNVNVQYLSQSLVGIKDKKRTSDTEITFATNEVNTNSLYKGKKTALIVWVDKDDYNNAVASLSK